MSSLHMLYGKPFFKFNSESRNQLVLNAWRINIKGIGLSPLGLVKSMVSRVFWAPTGAEPQNIQKYNFLF